MANFGWAYVNCEDTGSHEIARGPSGSLQFITGSPGIYTTSGSYWLSASYDTPWSAGIADEPVLILSGILAIGKEQTSTPSKPKDGGGGFLYAKSDGGLYWRSYEGIYNLTQDTGSSVGPSGSVQFKKGDTNQFTGSSAFVFELSNKVLSSSCGVQYSYTGSIGKSGEHGTYTIALSDYLVGVDSQQAVTLTLPAATAAGYGHSYVIKDETGQAHTNNITINTNGSNTIDGQNSIILGSPYISISIYCNGKTGWHIY